MIYYNRFDIQIMEAAKKKQERKDLWKFVKVYTMRLEPGVKFYARNSK